MRVVGAATARIAWTAVALMSGAVAGAEAPANPRRTPVVEVVEQTRGAVVNISSTKTIQVRRTPNPFDIFFQDFDDCFAAPQRSLRTSSVGSGFVIHESGYIITNAHVADRTADVQITFDSGASYLAEIQATDNEHDLALLKIDAREKLPVIRLGASSDLMIGETVIAIGNPLGYQHTVTTGVVSATKRDLELRNEKTGQPVLYANLIQTDASINPGNSGGPLLNVLGELIGINTAIRSDAQNIGFAIPVDALKELLPVMLRNTAKNEFSLGLTIDPQRRVLEIQEGSPVDRADLEVGDIITQVDRRAIQSDVEFYLELMKHQPGERVVLDRQRSGKTDSALVLLQEPPRPDGRQLAEQKLGVKLEPLAPELARSLGLGSGSGLLVAEVERGGPAHLVRVAPGDILTSLNGYAVRDLNSVGQILADAQAGQRMPIRIIRQEGGLLFADGTYMSLR